MMARTDTAHTDKTTISKVDRRMLLGLSLDWWNEALLWSLGGAAIAAVFVVLATYAVIRLQKLEALDNAKEVARAHESAAKANVRAEEAHAKSQQSELELAKWKAPRLLNESQAQTLLVAMQPFAGQRVSVGAVPFTFESATLADLLVRVLVAAKVKADHNQGAAQLQVGAANGVVARFATGNTKGKALAFVLVASLNDAGIRATALDGLLESVMDKTNEQLKITREHESHSWVVVVVGDK